MDKTLPSVASGVSPEALKAAQEEYKSDESNKFPPNAGPRVFWLIQRYNGKAQDRWNLVKPQSLEPNKIDTTLFALTHFLWEDMESDQGAVVSHYQSKLSSS
jgi:hypothetical protein